MEGRFDGVSVRDPVVVGSISDVVFVVGRDTTADEVNDVLREDPRASIVQLDLTRVVGGNLVKVMSWYDNEWGFTSQMVQVAVQRLGLDAPASV
jgi:glyceraldehyde 3-phosphate dehydrogenase